MSDKLTLIMRENHPVKNRAVEAIRRAPDGYIFTLQEPTRTLAQNALLHVLLNRLVISDYRWHGYQMGMEDWKNFFSAAIHGQKAVPNIEGTGFIILGKKTSKMTIREVSEMVEMVKCFATERGIDLGPEAVNYEPTGRTK